MFRPFGPRVDLLCVDGLACAPCGGWDNQTSIWLVQQRPLPFRILALTLDITFA